MVVDNTAPRSKSNPLLTLEEALKRIVKFKVALGVNGSFSRETVSKGIGYGSVSGTSGRAVASLVHYGLLDRSKDMYSLSDLGKRYLLPIDDSQRDNAIREAALSPSLFRAVFNDFEGQFLPNQLANILTVKYEIQYNAASAAVKIMESTFNFAGLLTDKGVLQNKITKKPIDPDNQSDNVAQGAAGLPQQVTVQVKDIDLGGSAQTVNENGDGWSLVVSFQNNRHLDTKMRKRVRLFIESAHDLVDELYELDEAPIYNQEAEEM